MYISHTGKYTSFIKFRFGNKPINFKLLNIPLNMDMKKT